MNDLFGSAEGSISVLAMVCKGTFFGRASRAWRAASLADWRAAEGGGDGREEADAGSSSSMMRYCSSSWGCC